MQNETINLAKNGCEKSLGKIYDYLINDVTAKTKSMLIYASEFEVEDTIIVSMTKILTTGLKFYQSSEASFRTFALRIAQNNALDTIRKNKKSIFTAIDDTMQVSDNLVSAEQITSFDVKEKSIDLSVLTERQKNVITLRVDGASYKEIAAQLNITMEDVKNAVSRAKSTLKKNA